MFETLKNPRLLHIFFRCAWELGSLNDAIVKMNADGLRISKGIDDISKIQDLISKCIGPAYFIGDTIDPPNFENFEKACQMFHEYSQSKLWNCKDLMDILDTLNELADGLLEITVPDSPKMFILLGAKEKIMEAKEILKHANEDLRRHVTATVIRSPGSNAMG